MKKLRESGPRDPGSEGVQGSASLSMGRRQFLMGALAAGASVASGVPRQNADCCDGTLAYSGRPTSARSSAGRPNIVYVFSDTHRNCSWSGGGNPQVLTPNLDGMAGQGVTFTNCVSNFPLCSPYRACLLTGRYPQSNTVRTNVSPFHRGLPTSELSLARELKDHGYQTGYVGKWHLYPGQFEGVQVPAGPHRHGFDDYWRPCHNLIDRYRTRTFDDEGRVCTLASPAHGNYAPACQTDLALSFIEANAENPFCLFLSWDPPHPPYGGAPWRYLNRYNPFSLRMRENVPASLNNIFVLWQLQGSYAHITALDEQLGRILQSLDRLGIADNTIVVYTSDHGEMFGSQGQHNKEKPWEESVNVPFVIRWPAGIPGDRRLDTLFSTVDIAPTLLGLAGLEAPAVMQGTDISGTLSGRGGPEPDEAFLMNIRGNQDSQTNFIGDWRGVRTHRYTYVRHLLARTSTPWLLYDNLEDPQQRVNRVGDPSYASVRQELESRLNRSLDDQADTFGR